MAPVSPLPDGFGHRQQQAYRRRPAAPPDQSLRRAVRRRRRRSSRRHPVSGSRARTEFAGLRARPRTRSVRSERGRRPGRGQRQFLDTDLVVQPTRQLRECPGHRMAVHPDPKPSPPRAARTPRPCPRARSLGTRNRQEVRTVISVRSHSAPRWCPTRRPTIHPTAQRCDSSRTMPRNCRRSSASISGKSSDGLDRRLDTRQRGAGPSVTSRSGRRTPLLRSIRSVRSSSSSTKPRDAASGPRASATRTCSSCSPRTW